MRIQLWKRWICLLLFVLLFTGCSAANPAETTQQPEQTDVQTTKSREYFTTLKGNKKDTFTIMLYVNGGIAESEYGLATALLGELLEADLGENVNVILEMGGTDAWQNEHIASDTGARLLLDSEGLFVLEGGPAYTNISSSDKLKEFVASAQEEFPASRYALIFWGSLPMDMADIKAALSGSCLDFIGFDTEAVDSAETAYMLQDAADYLIAHTGAYAAMGWNYDTLLSALSQNSSLPTSDIAQIVSEGMSSNEFYFYTDLLPGVYCADLTEVSYLFTCINSFLSHAQKHLLAGDFAQIALARCSCDTSDRVAVTDIASALAYDESAPLLEAYDTMIVYASSDTSGLSIYFPTDAPEAVEQMLSYYEAQGIAYESFVSSYMSILLGGKAYVKNEFAATSQEMATTYPWYNATLAADYAELYYENYRYDSSVMKLWWKNDHYALVLYEGDETTLANLSIYTYIDTGEDYVLLNKIAITEKDADQDVIAPATDEWLAINGQTVSYAAYSKEDVAYYLVPAYWNDTAVSLVVLKDNTTPDGRVAGVIVQKGPYTDFSIISSGDLISFRYDFYSYDNLRMGESTYGVTIAVADTLRVSTESVDAGDVLICCIATDIFGVTYASESVNIRQAAIING